MTDISDEIMQRARETWEDLMSDDQYDHPKWGSEIIARALMEAEARGYAAAREQAVTKIEDAGGSMAEYYAGLIRAMEMSDETHNQ